MESTRSTGLGRICSDSFGLADDEDTEAKILSALWVPRRRRRRRGNAVVIVVVEEAEDILL